MATSEASGLDKQADCRSNNRSERRKTDMLKEVLIRSFSSGFLLILMGMVYGVTEGERGNTSGMFAAGKAVLAGGVISGVSILAVIVYMLYCILQMVF